MFSKIPDTRISLPSLLSEESIILKYLEDVTQLVVAHHIQTSLRSSSLIFEGKCKDQGVVYVVKSPARIDLAGGWSDTPPICYDIGGAVSICKALIYLALCPVLRAIVTIDRMGYTDSPT